MFLEYGIIGNCRTCALVKNDATISWLCLPRFDGASVFAKLLDPNAGKCSISPLGKSTIKQEYLPNTAILKTRFEGEDWAFSVYDFFPKFTEKPLIQNLLTRIVKVEHGKPIIKVIYDPKPDYARGQPTLVEENGQVIVNHPKQKVYMRTSLPLTQLKSTFNLEKDFYMMISDEPIPEFELKDAERIMNKTKIYWEYIIKQTTTPIKYRKQVIRSVITLKLLQYAPTGAFVAAATTSLPEVVGGVRNWDYRYCWLRDASFTVSAFTRVSKFEETVGFMRFLENVCKRCTAENGAPHLQIMYGIDGRHELEEKTLNHLQGFQNSRPVRIGNAAYDQKQLDVAGEVLEAMSIFYTKYQYTEELPDYAWNLILILVKQIEDTWQNKDNGIWEFRNINEHFTHSKLLCWMGMKSAIEIAQAFNKEAPLTKWARTRDTIKEELLKNAWNEEKQAFTMYYGGDSLDASTLLMPLLGIIEAKDPRMVSTIDAIQKELRTGCCYVFRYKQEDDFGTPKNSFSLCAFWLVQALHLMGKTELAKEIFEHLLTHTNKLGLFSEGINPQNQELTGNFPQAFTHLAVINTATMLTQPYEPEKDVL